MSAAKSTKETWSRRWFDRWSRTYDKGRISPWFQYTQHMAIDALDLQPDSRTLDIGCGTGYATRVLGERLVKGRACGVDISPGMIERARQQTPPELASRVEFRVGSALELPWEDETFTHILCTNSFHHYPDPMKALREMKRVLVPRGQVVIFENAPDLSWYTWMWDKLLRLIEPGHVRYYPSRELGEMIERAGFVERELRVLRNEKLKHGKLFASIQLWSARKPGA